MSIRPAPRPDPSGPPVPAVARTASGTAAGARSLVQATSALFAASAAASASPSRALSHPGSHGRPGAPHDPSAAALAVGGPFSQEGTRVTDIQRLATGRPTVGHDLAVPGTEGGARGSGPALPVWVDTDTLPGAGGAHEDDVVPGLPLALTRQDLDELVDSVVERIEQRVVDELERRGRHYTPGAF